jgi:hypothetical protein
MDTYEVHVPCGQKVIVICKEKGEEVKVVKNGEPVYGEKNPNKNLPRFVEENDNDNDGEAPEAEQAEDAEKAPATDQKNSNENVENNMAGGKKSRRNNARKANATRRKGQAGGKRGPNGYMKFANKIRPQILKEHPELKSDVVGVARKIGEKWRSLSDAEKKKY